jgi:hypothetical protein
LYPLNPGYAGTNLSTEVGGASFEGKVDLVLALGEAGSPVLRDRAGTHSTAHTFDVPGFCTILGSENSVAVDAHLLVAGNQPVPHGDSPVEHVALTFPRTIGLGNCLEIAENASIQLVDVVETLLPEVGRCFFASDTSRTEHRDLRLVDVRSVGLDPIGELRE